MVTIWFPVSLLFIVYSVSAETPRQQFCSAWRPLPRNECEASGPITTLPAAIPYEVRPLKLGVEVHGIDLADDLNPSIIERIKSDAHTYILRASNDQQEGKIRVGNASWHIDGFYRRAPHLISLYHMPHVAQGAPTMFCGLAELIDGLSTSQRERWDKVWIVVNRRKSIVHPLIYRHPITRQKVFKFVVNKFESTNQRRTLLRKAHHRLVNSNIRKTKPHDETLCLNPAMSHEFVENYGRPTERVLDPQEAQQIRRELHEAVVTENGRLIYRHKWEPGDFIISDNLAVAHKPAPEAHYPKEQIGLRVLHRVTVKGTAPPEK